MSRQILVNVREYETRVVSLENGEIKQLHIERREDRNVVGNIYKGVVKRVLPGMQAAFLELGLERTAFLYVDDIITDPLGENESSSDAEDVVNTDHEDIQEESRKGGRFSRQRRAPKRQQKRNANIQDLIKEGQELLVQVAKAPIGTKGARLTTHLSIPGRNLVLMPTSKHVGMSRRIENERERKRLKEIFLKKIRPKGVGFILRTVAQGKNFKDLKADCDYLLKLWEHIKQENQKRSAPALIHGDLPLFLRAVRDYLTDDVDEFIIDYGPTHEKVLDFISQYMPRVKKKVKFFKGPTQLFAHYGIEEEITRALGRKVWLKSGGYLLIDQSEALTSIDVNTGRYVGSRNLEETILKTNLEAVNEIAYQLRIRNVGGIIVLDLIDMENHDNRDKVYKALNQALTEDKARTNILKISELGLVEMTRKRTHEDLVRSLTEECHNCEGRGYHKSKETVCFEIFREVEKEVADKTNTIVIFANNLVIDYCLEKFKDYVEDLQKRVEKTIILKKDPQFHIEQYEVFARY